ncbi:MAG: helix-turn-helix domain-containing protein [Gemmatimonadota bacterium]|nr:helix-turn-helix domain-containing protein [Gemmatimonadota bacterium]
MTVNTIDGIRVSDWIGHDLERLRKLRGLRREDVAAQLSVPVSASTIRNIEHDEHYNVSLDLLRQIATVLGAELRVTLDVRDDEAPVEPAQPAQPAQPAESAESAARGRRVVDNEYFIRYIRERYPECPLTNSQIGRRMWSFAESRGAELVRERKQLKRVESTGTHGHRSPTTAAEYQVWERDFVALERFADRLGRAFSDGKGGFLVPAA